MDHLRNAQETTPISRTVDGKPQKSWRSDRIFLASKVCAFCGKEWKPWVKYGEDTKIISTQGERNWNKQIACSLSCSKKLKNPMSNHQSKMKMIAKLREIRHKPIKRGGNGQLLPLPQLALLHALGEGWESEFAVATKMGHRNGTYPNCYKLDIANPTLMIGIEIDGNCHTTLARKTQDKKKTDLLISQGWSIYRLSNDRALHLYSTFKSVDTLLISLTEN